MCNTDLKEYLTNKIKEELGNVEHYEDHVVDDLMLFYEGRIFGEYSMRFRRINSVQSNWSLFSLIKCIDGKDKGKHVRYITFSQAEFRQCKLNQLV